MYNCSCCIKCTMSLKACPLPTPGVTMPEGSVVISQEDIDNHNREGGAWVIIHGKVYDVQSLSTQVRTCRMVALTLVGGHCVHLGIGDSMSVHVILYTVGDC